MKPFKNIKGSIIKRGGSIKGHKYTIGKVIGGKVYMHINYINTLPNPQEAQNALRSTKNSKIKCLSYDPAKAEYMFSEAPNFNDANEPIPGTAIKVVVKDNKFEVNPPKFIKSIWHHKFLWVSDDYRGFNVREAYEWSKTWSAKISNPSGSKRVWIQQLEAADLVTENKFYFISKATEVINEITEFKY